MRNRDNWQADCFSKNRAIQKCKVDFTFVKPALHCHYDCIKNIQSCILFEQLYKKHTKLYSFYTATCHFGSLTKIVYNLRHCGKFRMSKWQSGNHGRAGKSGEKSARILRSDSWLKFLVAPIFKSCTFPTSFFQTPSYPE